MQMKKLAIVLFVIVSILLITVMLITSIEVFALNTGFYEKEYDKLKQNEIIGISRDELKQVTKNLIDYTAGARENLDMQAKINGETREVFNNKEKEHMVDVKILYLAARDTRNIALILFMVLLAAGLLLYKKGGVKALLNAYLRVSVVFLVVIAAIGLYAAIDFYAFWTSFHRLFFANNLWILDPSTDVLIMMVPGQFFSDLVARIIILFASGFLASIIASMLARRYIKKHERQAAA
jgi:integral membrane protein (TIGR01906 family)